MGEDANRREDASPWWHPGLSDALASVMPPPSVLSRRNTIGVVPTTHTHMKRLRMQNGEVVSPEDLHIAPLVILDCCECPGYTDFRQESSTVVVCEECGTEQSNENIVDLNDKRL